mgnify:CR=1 FL=1
MIRQPRNWFDRNVLMRTTLQRRQDWNKHSNVQEIANFFGFCESWLLIFYSAEIDAVCEWSKLLSFAHFIIEVMALSMHFLLLLAHVNEAALSTIYIYYVWWSTSLPTNYLLSCTCFVISFLVILPPPFYFFPFLNIT